MIEDLDDFRELTRSFLRPRQENGAPPTDAMIAQWTIELRDGFATYSDIGPVPSEWRGGEFLLDNPDHPFIKRFTRQRAAGLLREASLTHPDSITTETLSQFHMSLFDICAAVAGDVAIALGILARPESKEFLERFSALMATEKGWWLNLSWTRWSILRITNPSSVEPPRGTDLEPVIAVKKLGPDTVHLVRLGDKHVLRNPESKVEVAVSAREAQLFSSTSEARLDDFFRRAGGLNGSSSDSRIGAVATGLVHGLPHGEVLTTLTDTSTINMARLAVQGFLAPEALLDLSVLVHCCIFYDFVLVDAVDLDVPEELRDVILPVRPYEGADVDPRWDIAVARHNELRADPSLQNQLEQSWAAMLGQHVNVDFHSFDSITTSPGVGQYFPADSTVGFYDPVESLGIDSPEASRNLTRDVSIQTFRYWINEKVAETLGTAYNCTTLRYPVESIALNRRSAYLSTAEEIVNRVAPVVSPVVQQPATSGLLGSVQIPHPLSIVLSNAASRDQIWQETLRLRDRLEPVRSVLRQGRRTGESDSLALNRIFKGLFTGSDWAQQIDTGIAIASAIASSTTGGTDAGSMMLKVASVAKPASKFKVLADRVIHPEIYVLRKFSDDVAQIRNQVGVIERLWGAAPDRRWLATAARISMGSAHEAGRLRQ